MPGDSHDRQQAAPTSGLGADTSADFGSERTAFQREYEDCVVNLPEGVVLGTYVLSRWVDDCLELTPGTRKALAELGCDTIGGLLTLKASALMAKKGVGRVALRKLRAEFAEKIVATAVDVASDAPSGDGHVDSAVPRQVYEPRLVELPAGQDLPAWVLDAPVAAMLSLPPASAAALENLGVYTVGGLFDVTLADFLSQKGVGVAAVRRLREAVGSLNSDAAVGSELSPSAQARYTRRPPLEFDIVLSSKVGEASRDSHPDLACLPAAELDEALRLFMQSDSYEDLVEQCLADASTKLSARDSEAFKLRHGIGCTAQTLRATGNQLGLSGERIRQKLDRLDAEVDFSRLLRFLPVRNAVFAAARELGGSGASEALVTLASRRLEPKDGELGDVVQFVPEVELSADGASFFIVGLACKTCPALVTAAEELDGACGCVEEAAFVERVGCPACGSGFRATAQLVSSVTPLIAACGHIGAKDSPRMAHLQNPTNKRALMRLLLSEADQALTCEQIVELAAERGVKLTKAHVVSTVQSFPECMLWGKGTYIHERNVVVPEQQLSRIVDFVIEYFKEEDVPIVGVGGLYDVFRDELEAGGVPGKQALYSLLRRVENSRLELREYPWVCDKAAIDGRTTFAKYFYSVLAQNGGFMTDACAEEIARKTMAQDFALGGLAEYTPYAMHVNGSWYDRATMDVDTRGIAGHAGDAAAGLGDRKQAEQ